MRFFSDYFKYLASQIITPSRSFKDWDSKNLKLQKVRLKNKKLAEELAAYCQQKGGVLTFGEFINQEMFGENGYYKNHRDFGQTIVHNLWPEAIVNFCRKKSIHSIVEVGCGNAKLAKKTLELAKKRGVNINWIGIEINEDLVKKLKKNKIKNFSVSSSFKNLKRNKYLTIFPYSLDSMASEVIINHTLQKAPADKMLGIKVQNGILEEVLLSEQDLKQKELVFENGIIKKGNFDFDFSSWLLRPNQRAYLSLYGFLTIIDYLKIMAKGSAFLIIDEMKLPQNFSDSYHLGTPRILNSFIRDYETLNSAYQNSGDNLWYFPLYLNSLLGFLKELELMEIEFDKELEFSANLKGEVSKTSGPSICYATTATVCKNKTKNNFRIPPP